MGTVVLAGATSGTTTLSPTDAVTATITLPSATDTLVGKATTDTLTNKTLTAPVLSGSITGTYTLAGTPTTGASLITSGTAQNSTSGTSIDFTGIPSWVKRITVMFNGVSTNGVSYIQVQLGAGSITTSGYSSVSGLFYSSSAQSSSATTGFHQHGAASASTRYGLMTITNITSNTWVSSFSMGDVGGGAICAGGGGSLALGGTLDRLRITTVNGTDTFDAGSINILYE
jgi:hypothetical protein